MNVLDRVKMLADQKDISIPELEKKLGFGNGSIYKWGKSMPSADKLSAVADYFNVTTDYLLGRTENKRSYSLSEDTLSNTDLNARDKRDIAKNLEKIVADLDDETAGPLFYGGELPDEDKDILKGILEQALVIAKVKNKAKYTPKKYRNNQDQPDD